MEIQDISIVIILKIINKLLGFSIFLLYIYYKISIYEKQLQVQRR